MVKPSISMPNSMSNKPNFYNDDDASGPNQQANGSSRPSGKNEGGAKMGSGLPSKQSGQRWWSILRFRKGTPTHYLFYHLQFDHEQRLVWRHLEQAFTKAKEPNDSARR